MRIVDTYPLLTVTRLAESCAFFVEELGMEIVFRAAWVVMLARPGEEGIRLGLMSSDHPSSPPGPETFDGRGMIVTVQVDDAAAWHGRLRSAGVAIGHPLTDAPWGQRRFMVEDPSGIRVDVVEQIDPAPGYWDRYLQPAAPSGR